MSFECEGQEYSSEDCLFGLQLNHIDNERAKHEAEKHVVEEK